MYPRRCFRAVRWGDAAAPEVRSDVSRLIFKEEALRLETALESLDPDHREVILLPKYEEFSFEEIGGRLGRSPDACRMLHWRVRSAESAEH